MNLLRSAGRFGWPGITILLCAVAISCGSADVAAATGTFDPVKGAYAGLFYDTNQTAHASSGFLKLDVTKSGAFSASIVVAGRKYSFSGRFPPPAAVSKSVARKTLGPVTVSMQLNLNGGNGLTGSVTDGTWTSALTADRATHQAKANPAPETGRYTFLIPGSEDPSMEPGGDGFGALTVNRSGQVTFIGILGDGTKVSEKTFVSSHRRWPLYASRGPAEGSILGWLTFSNKPYSDLDGFVSWIELSQPSAAFYPAGFTNETKAFGLAYHFTNGVRVINSTTGQFWSAGGNLPESFTNQIFLRSNNTVSNLNDNPMRLTLTPQSGFFEGRVVDPVTGRTNSFRGVVLQQKRLNASSPDSQAPAGWNTWYGHGSEVSEDVIKNEMAGLDYLHVLDLYPNFGIWIDDGWQATQEPRINPMRPPMWDTNKFPNGLTNLVALIHSHGYKAYLYTEPNPRTSAGFTGSSIFFESDARLFASWGFDGVKFDQPSGALGDSWRMDNLRRMMTAFQEAAPDRDVLFWSSGWLATNAQLISSAPTGSIIRYGYGFADWGNEGYPAGDWYGVYVNFLKRVDSYITLDLLRANGPGHWLFTEACLNNSPIGRPTVSMWAMWGAPMIFSELLASPQQIYNAMNPELYAIARDPLWFAALPIQTNATYMVWLKPLADDSVAVALLNRTRDEPQTIGFTWGEIGLKNSRRATVFDVWDRNLTVTSGSYTSSVPGQTVQVLRIFPEKTNIDRFSCFGSGLFLGTNQTGRVCIQP